MPTKTLTQYLTELSDVTSLAAADQMLITRSGGMNVANVGDVLLNYSGFIDPHAFGARGDTVKYTDGITYSGEATFGSTSHVFTPADVGKRLYVDVISGSRTITSYIDPHRVGISGAAITTGGTNRYWIMGTDDTAALRAALAAAGRNRGGGIAGGLAAGSRNANYGKIVMLRPDSRYLVRNTAADLAAGRYAALEIPPRCGITGMAGVRNAQIVGAPDNHGHVIANQQPDSFADFITLANFSVDCLGNLASNSQNGIHLDLAFNGYAEVDAFFNIFNVDVREARQNNLYLNGRGEGIVSNCRFLNARESGVYMYDIMDSTFVAMNSGGSRKTGFRVERSAANRLVACKAFYSGAAGAAVAGDCAGWWLTSDHFANNGNQYIGCESQESRGSGWLVESGYGHFIGCKSADPGRRPIAGGTLPAVRAGFAFQSAQARFNTMVGCVVQPDLGMWEDDNQAVVENEIQQPDRTGRNWGYATDSVYLDGNAEHTRGEVWTYPLTDYDQAYGPVGGAGRNNGRNTALRVDGASLT